MSTSGAGDQRGTKRPSSELKAESDDAELAADANKDLKPAATHQDSTEEQNIRSNVEDDVDARKLNEKRAYNRRNAARARQRVRDQLTDLSRKVERYSSHNEELMAQNENLNRQVELLQAEVQQLRQAMAALAGNRQQEDASTGVGVSGTHSDDRTSSATAELPLSQFEALLASLRQPQQQDQPWNVCHQPTEQARPFRSQAELAQLILRQRVLSPEFKVGDVYGDNNDVLGLQWPSWHFLEQERHRLLTAASQGGGQVPPSLAHSRRIQPDYQRLYPLMSHMLETSLASSRSPQDDLGYSNSSSGLPQPFGLEGLMEQSLPAHPPLLNNHERQQLLLLQLLQQQHRRNRSGGSKSSSRCDRDDRLLS